ncbi:dipeptide epimerase [Rapidithrix thailandica]|uniref:Dipeptide epimerase n=1 Tax=Rapidithrix thailandica TaxID=413964 RepID=A0AAW9SCM4_9BACT
MSQLLIKKIELYPSEIPLKAPFITSLEQLEYAANVIVRIHTNHGFIGYGECSPFKTINGESMETGMAVGQYLAKALLRQNPLDLEACSALMDKAIYGNSSIKSALDMALFDLAAQQAGLPLYAFLGGNNRKPLVTDYTVSLDEPSKMAQDALQIKEAGFSVIKVKLGAGDGRDVERIRLIREVIGEKIPLRIDANQGWNVPTAISTLQALAPYHIQHCEEPIPRWLFMDLPKIKAQSPIPIMADESCCDHHDAQRLIALDACTSFNLKLGKSSGLLKAQKIVKLAEEAGMEMQVGGFLESRLAFTASAHLALSSDRIVYFDFDTPLMFAQDPVVGGMSYLKNGTIKMPEVPGLGASFDASYLESLEKVVIE